MLITILAAGGEAAAKGANPYGLGPALREGGLISQAVFSILVLMSIVSFYILFSKLFEQQKVMNQAKRMRQGFWNAANLREGSAKLEKNSAYKQIVDDGLSAQEQHTRLTDPVERMTGCTVRSRARKPRSTRSSAAAWRSSPPSVRCRRSSACSVPSSASTAR